MLPCLARPLSLSCHATTIAQLDVSVCLMFKRVVLCTCAPCCLACCVSLPPSCPCALPLACPASLCLCCLSLPWLLCGLSCPDWPCSLLPGPAVFSLCPPGCGYPSEGKPCIFLGGYLTLSTGVSSFVRLALTHGLLCSLHGVPLVLCSSYGLELLPCHCLLPCLLHSGIKARIHRAFIFLKKFLKIFSGLYPRVSLFPEFFPGHFLSQMFLVNRPVLIYDIQDSILL